MDTRQKKRSIFGSLNFWGRNSIASTGSDQPRPTDAANTSVTAGAAGLDAPPESPVKRASAAQLSARKIIDRPHGPSSRLSQSINKGDFGLLANTSRPTNFSTSTIATPRTAGTAIRMPGDNPNKPATGLVHFSATNRRAADLSGSATMPRNIFRASFNDRPNFPSSPKVTRSAVNQSFPQPTPARAPRSSGAEINGRALPHTSSTSLFAMRIPSPPRDLTGERLAKEVPGKHDRTGSVYADEFLSDYCPPDFDDLQRRQFFCILDLRRLKYAADEVFAKKDWKINILNFAKEYEKSRSLIMLRYGLYEFKTVKASEAIKKQWQKEHGIPNSDGESEPTSSPKPSASLGVFDRGTAKRKAQEDPGLKDSVPAASSTSFNKRRATEREPVSDIATPNKVKRKASELAGSDENQPSKVHKSTLAAQSQPASSVKSIFEKIANGPPSDSATTAPTPWKPVANGLLGQLVSDPASKSSAAGNIFGRLSDANKTSGNEDADADAETEPGSDSEGEEDSEGRETDRIKEASVGLFGERVTSNVPSGTPSEADEGAKGRSLFDRLTYGTDGQPVRVLPPRAGETKQLTPQSDGPENPNRESAAPPSNNTWNTDTPIKFASGPAQPASAASPATQKPGSIFAPEKSASAAPFSSSSTPKPTADALTSATEASRSGSSQPFPAKPPSLFGGEGTAPAFGSIGPKPTETGPKLFSTATGAFGQPKSTEQEKDTTITAPAAPLFGQPTQENKDAAPAVSNAPTTSLFGKPPQREQDATAPASAPFSSLFGQTAAGKQGTSSPAPPVSTPLFGKPAEAKDVTTPAPVPVTSASFMFGKSDEKKDTPSPAPLFGKPSENKDTTTAASPATDSSLSGATPKPSEPETSKPPAVFQSSTLFGSTSNGSSSASKPLFSTPTANLAGPSTSETQASLFSSGTPKPASSLFGASAMPSTSAPESDQSQPKSLFGATSSQPSMAFGAVNATAPPASSDSANSSGGTASAGAPVSKPLFGGVSSSQGEADKSKPSIFANPTSTGTSSGGIFGFGGAQGGSQTPQFGAGASQPTATQNSGSVFGNGGSSSFTFSAGGGQQQSSFNNPFATNGSTSAPPSFDFGSNAPTDKGGQPQSAPFVFGGSTPSISFGAGSGTSTPAAQATNGGSNVFSFGGGGSSQPGGSTIFSQQPAAGSMFTSSLAPPAGGVSTGTNTPFTLGGVSSLATTPAAGTPEPGARSETGQGTQADGDDAPQEQISLTDGGPGEEDESVVYEVRAKALKLVVGGDDESEPEGGKSSRDKKKSPWQVQGVGPLRLLKNKTTEAVRILLRAEPRGHIALNKRVLPDFLYKPEPAGGKYVKITTANDKGDGLQTWMLQVKTKELAQTLADALEANKSANKK